MNDDHLQGVEDFMATLVEITAVLVLVAVEYRVLVLVWGILVFAIALQYNIKRHKIIYLLIVLCNVVIVLLPLPSIIITVAPFMIGPILRSVNVSSPFTTSVGKTVTLYTVLSICTVALVGY